MHRATRGDWRSTSEDEDRDASSRPHAGHVQADHRFARGHHRHDQRHRQRRYNPRWYTQSRQSGGSSKSDTPIQDTLAAMRQAEADADVQQDGCKSLGSIAYHCNNIHTHTLIVREGGIEAVVRAMRRHADNASVQYFGCSVLQTLAINSKDERMMSFRQRQRSSSSDNANRDAAATAGARDGASAADPRQAIRNRLLEQGAVALVVTAMVRHQHNVGIHRAACAVLKGLTIVRNTFRIMVDASAIEAVVGAMSRFVGDTDVQCSGCAVLRNLAAEAHLAF
ncbi:hypothetical protein PTSG_08950 [Salpingoeca rosetta]|uniref:Uncharacterized protein n=1 Tax=Salpingoeca rosetta (strain ATCC 50818 / BSB-021) TaxID=946362 RepID=F2ULS2_SALR5|nr:uncharacterized protein PTSG_08950 [Salpingoeca rosetta]EGD78071.1 hypothetical protein PTSG_08950 [Salpingoeca rosetta]|eukprot:XP_004989747.1 hypothetical protein PTSG_08950 [Salpingoeca rosetta]